MDKLIIAHQQSHPYMTPEQCCAYALPFPNREHTYFVFEKIYDHTMFGTPELQTLKETPPDFTTMFQKRWFCLSDDESPYMDHFGLSGKNNFSTFTKQYNDVYMVGVVETPTTIEDWFNSQSIDLNTIHITMMAFIPTAPTEQIAPTAPTTPTEPVALIPFAVHFFINKNKQNKSPIERVSIPLHGFSATIITCITENDNIVICSSPNQRMFSILCKDINENRDSYQISSPTEPDTILNEDVKVKVTFGEFGIGATGTNIAILAKRLANRFCAFYDSKK